MHLRRFHLQLSLLGVVVSVIVVLAGRPAFAEGSAGATIPLQDNTDRFADQIPRYARARLGTLRWRHGAEIFALAYHPDGKTIASATRDGVIHLWEVASGRTLRGFAGHEGIAETRVRCIAFNRKGDRFAAVVSDTPLGQVVRDRIVMWDYGTRKKLWERRMNEALTPLAFSPDGTTLAVVGLSRIFVLDTKTATEQAQFEHEEPDENDRANSDDTYISFSRDGNLLGAARCGIAYIWDVAAKKRRWTSALKDGHVSFLVFSPDGKLFACGLEKQIVIRDVESKKTVGTIPACGISSHIRFSPNGKILAVAASSPDQLDTITFWDVAARKRIQTTKWEYVGRAGFFSILSLFDFSPDGKHFAWGVRDHRVHIMDVATGEESASTREPQDVLNSLAYSPDGRTLALGSSYRSVYLWDPIAVRQTKTLTADKMRYLTSLGFSADGKTLAMGSSEHIDFWNMATGKQLRPDKVDDSRWGSAGVALLSGGTLVLSGIGDGFLGLWERKSGRELHRFRAGEGLESFALSPNENWLATRDDEGSLIVWDMRTRKEYLRLKVSPDPWDREQDRAIAFSPDSNFLAVVDKSKVIRFWEVISGKPCLQLNDFDSIWSIAFSPNGRFLASGGKNKIISIWDLATGKRAARLTGHLGAVTALAFSPDGKTLASASKDTTALLWRWREALLTREQTPPLLSARDLQRSWNDLSSRDAKVAYRAMWSLAAVPEQAIPLLREHVQAVAAPDASRITGLIVGLGNDSFAERNKAMRELEAFGDLARAQLRKAMLEDTSLEIRRRAKELVERLDRPLTLPRKLEYLRALVILEQTKTTESTTLLKRLADGAPESRMTKSAKAALDRLNKPIKP